VREPREYSALIAASRLGYEFPEAALSDALTVKLLDSETYGIEQMQRQIRANFMGRCFKLFSIFRLLNETESCLDRRRWFKEDLEKFEFFLFSKYLEHFRTKRINYCTFIELKTILKSDTLESDLRQNKQR
jgi:hypothetical protein